MLTTGKLILLGSMWYCQRIRVEPGFARHRHPVRSAGSGAKTAAF